jgi:hypothetical protein
MSRKLLALFVGLLFSTSAFATDAQIKLKGYSDEDVERYELMTQRAAPLEVIGVGQPSYLMSLHEGTYSWSITVPDGSTAELSSTTTQEVYFIVDMVGEYTVTLDYTDGEGAASSSSQVINGANYVGVAAGNCALCHSEQHTDWLATGHASITERDLDGVTSSHIQGFCNSCHATGYDPDSMAVNGGFDDAATAEGWVFPDTLMVGNYDDLVTNYPATAALANVQCESCHGPGSEHPSNVASLAVSKSGEVCKYCHDSPDHHPQATQWVTSVHGSDVNPEEHFAESGSCVACHTAEGFFEQNVDQVELTAPYAVPNGQSCVVCHDPHKKTTDFQLRVASDMAYIDDETGEPKYSTTGEIDQSCTVCHHHRPGRDYVGTVPHHSHQTEMLDGTTGWMNPDLTFPASNAHGTLIEKRCAGCHMVEGEGEKGNIVGGHTFKMHRSAGDTVNTVVLTEEMHLTEACVECHTGIGEDFDINGLQTKVTLMLNELYDRLPKATSGRLTGSPAYDSTDFVDGYISVDQMTAAFNWYIVDYDGSKGVHNPAMSLALLEDALDRVPALPECASNDINGDGQLGIADAVKLILMAAEDNTQACIDRNGDFVYDIKDVIKLIADIWASSSTMLAGTGGVELIHTQVELTADQIQYIESVIETLELTSEQAAAFQVALFGDGSGLSSLPKAFSLAQNSPNPFNPSTTIKFAVAEGKAGQVSLKVYDVRGRLVRSLVDGSKESGDYTVFWDGTNENGQKVSSGVYFYRMVTGSFMQTRKMVILK